MIICHRCGKENQDMYKFCLGCGAELRQAQGKGSGESNVAMMKTMMADVDGGAPSGHSHTPPGGMQPQAAPPAQAPYNQPPQQQQAPAGYQHQQQQQPFVGVPAAGQSGHAPAPAPAPAAAQPAPAPQGAMGAGAPQVGPKNCPACGTEVPPNFKFCGACGHRMDDATGPMPSPAAAAAAAQPAPAPAAQPQANPLRITLIRPDGSEGGTHELQSGENKIGREHGAMFENDGYLSPNHALLTINGLSASVRDLDSLNGVFV